MHSNYYLKLCSARYQKKSVNMRLHEKKNSYVFMNNHRMKCYFMIFIHVNVFALSTFGYIVNFIISSTNIMCACFWNIFFFSFCFYMKRNIFIVFITFYLVFFHSKIIVSSMRLSFPRLLCRQKMLSICLKWTTIHIRKSTHTLLDSRKKQRTQTNFEIKRVFSLDICSTKQLKSTNPKFRFIELWHSHFVIWSQNFSYSSEVIFDSVSLWDI